MAEPTIISLERSPSPPPFRMFSAHKEVCNLLGRAKSDPALQSLCDVDLKVGSRTFKAHRIILASSSPVLARMFTNGMRETTQRVVELQELNAHCFEMALEFIYSGEIELCCMDSAISLYGVAQRFQFDALQKLLDTFIGQKLTIHNTCAVIDLAETRNFPELKKVAMKKLEKQFVRIYQNSATFTQLSFETVEELFKSSKILLQGEVQVFRAIAFWLDPSTKESMFQDNQDTSGLLSHEHHEAGDPSIILQLDEDISDEAEAPANGEGALEVSSNNKTNSSRNDNGNREGARGCAHPNCLTYRNTSCSSSSSGEANDNDNTGACGGLSSYTMARGPDEGNNSSEVMADKLLALVRLDLMHEEDLKEIGRFEWCKKYTQFYNRILNIILKKTPVNSRTVELRKMKPRGELKDSRKRVRFIEYASSDFYGRGRHRRRLRSTFRTLDDI